MLIRFSGVVLVFVLSGFGAALGQTTPVTDADYHNVKGRLQVWTTQAVLRNEAKRGAQPEFLKLRFSRHPGFDRVVFDLKGDLASYYITYSKPPFQAEDGEKIIKVHGNAFVEISLYPVSSTNENIEANDKLVQEQQKLKMPVIREVKTVEWFEGEVRYVFGLNKRTPFRAQVLYDPLRLVVDFRN